MPEMSGCRLCQVFSIKEKHFDTISYTSPPTKIHFRKSFSKKSTTPTKSTTLSTHQTKSLRTSYDVTSRESIKKTKSEQKHTRAGMWTESPQFFCPQIFASDICPHAHSIERNTPQNPHILLCIHTATHRALDWSSMLSGYSCQRTRWAGDSDFPGMCHLTYGAGGYSELNRHILDPTCQRTSIMPEHRSSLGVNSTACLG
jgi:hypothetical protein